MPTVSINIARKLTKEQKSELAKGITDKVTEVTKVSDQAVTVIFNEIERDDIAKAGVLFSDRA